MARVTAFTVSRGSNLEEEKNRRGERLASVRTLLRAEQGLEADGLAVAIVNDQQRSPQRQGGSSSRRGRVAARREKPMDGRILDAARLLSLAECGANRRGANQSPRTERSEESLFV